MQAHFGVTTFDITIGPDLDLHHQDIVGETLGFRRQINIRTKIDDEPVAESYGRETLLHELLHAACRVAGFGHADEEAMVNALTAGLHQLLEDERNLAVISRLIPWASLALMKLTADKIESGSITMSGGPEPPRICRVCGRIPDAFDDACTHNQRSS